MAESAPERFALFPLTVFDKLFERTTFVTGWLVEGTIDTDAMAAALGRLTDKWRMLAGRVQSVKQENVSSSSEFQRPVLTMSLGYRVAAQGTSGATASRLRYLRVDHFNVGCAVVTICLPSAPIGIEFHTDDGLPSLDDTASVYRLGIHKPPSYLLERRVLPC